MVEIRPAARWDINELIPRLRQADVLEIAAGSGRDPVDVLIAGLTSSTRSWTALINEQVAAIFGVCGWGEDEGVGAPWLLGTDLIERNPRALIQNTWRYIAEMRTLYPTLRNFVHADNVKAVRWLRRAGFQVLPAVPYGRGMFHPFEMR